MRKVLLLSIFLFVSIFSFSQNKNIGIGLQSNFPTKGLSLRYDFDSTNQIQLSYTLYKDYSLNDNDLLPQFKKLNETINKMSENEI